MKEEVMKILKMVEQGSIDSETASKLISAIENGKNLGKTTVEKKKVSKVEMEVLKKEADKFLSEVPKGSELMLYVFVISSDGDKVKIKIPVSFIKLMLSATNKLPAMSGVENKVDMEMVKQAIDQGVCGRIVEIESEDGDYIIIEIR